MQIDWMPLVQLGLSLVAVLTLVWLARWFKLGGDFRIKDAGHAKQLAMTAIYGFEAIDAAVDRAGGSALLKDASSHHMLLAVKGTNIVARLLTPQMAGRLDQKFLTINVGEPSFPAITLNLGDKAQYWASGLRHIPGKAYSNA